VSNVPVQELQITITDPKKRNCGELRTGDSGKGQKSSEPAKSGKKGIPPEENFGHPKMTTGARSGPVKTVEPPGKYRRSRQSHPRKIHKKRRAGRGNTVRENGPGNCFGDGNVSKPAG